MCNARNKFLNNLLILEQRAAKLILNQDLRSFFIQYCVILPTRVWIPVHI